MACRYALAIMPTGFLENGTGLLYPGLFYRKLAVNFLYSL